MRDLRIRVSRTHANERSNARKTVFCGRGPHRVGLCAHATSEAIQPTPAGSAGLPSAVPVGAARDLPVSVLVISVRNDNEPLMHAEFTRFDGLGRTMLVLEVLR
jgi:hypothetical protein